MININDKILNDIKPLPSWIVIDKRDYNKYGIANTSEAKVVVSYKSGMLNNKENVVTLYNYGEDTSFINELSNSYNDLQLSIKEQEMYGIFPLHWEMFGVNKFFSVLKLIHNPIMNIIDVFFVYKNTVYCYHTHIPASEKNLKIVKLMKKYPDINYIIKVINEL